MTVNNPTIHIICGVHNNLNDTKQLLSSLVKQTYQHFKIIIVDDGSTDGTASYLAKHYPDITVLPGDGKLWWTGSVNLGIKHALETAKEDDYILTINNDCVMGEDYLSQLIKSTKAHSHSVIGSLVRDIHDHNKIVDAGIKIDWQRYKFNKQSINKGKSYNDKIDTLSTKGTLYPVTLFTEIGLLDVKHLPHYLSDYEFAYRAKRSDYKLVINYQAVVYNDSVRTGTVSRRSLFSRRSKVNLLDHLQFVRLCCPKEDKIRCYLSLVSRGLFG